MKMTEILLSLKDITVNYRLRRSLFRHVQVEALKDISFDLYRGETLGVIGKNGAGKSTLLRLLAGIYHPDIGTFHNYGVRVSLLSLQLGFDPDLTGRENIILSGMLLGHRKSVAVTNIDKIIDFSELGDSINRPIKTYSNGMRARLGFSIAITLHTDVILIDEVLAVGDAEFRSKAMRIIKERIRSEQTVILVSHAANQIRELCDRVLWIENGKIHRIGETNAVLHEYENHSALLMQ